jgi:type 1 glutamine amidotransferase
MKKLITILLSTILCLQSGAQTSSKKVLVFSKTTGYHHQSIPAGIAAITKLGAVNGFGVDTTTNTDLFTDGNLKQYAALIFLSTSGNLFDTVQKESLMRYIRDGGGFVGIHGASTSDKDWGWYGRLVGAVFTDHPKPQTANILVVDSTSPATRHLPRPWQRVDEWYNFKETPTGVHVLLCAGEHSYEGGKMGAYHPLAWYHNFEGGRSFYTALGHFDEAYSDPLFLKHLEKGIEWAMGRK